jgi:8-oxo-dGTP diphosphatase
MTRLPDEIAQQDNFDPGQMMPGLSVDNVIFGFHDDQLKVLLLECLNHRDWMLPGGFVFRTESVDAAASRVLEARTGLKNVFLQQFHVFGDPRRSREALMKSALKSMHMEYRGNKWFQQRTC